jgi:hypothetical protein
MTCTAAPLRPQQLHAGLSTTGSPILPKHLTWLPNGVAESTRSAWAPWAKPIGSGGIPGAQAGTWAACREPRNVAADGELQRSMSVCCREPAAHDANCNCHSKQLAAGGDHGVRTTATSCSCLQMTCGAIEGALSASDQPVQRSKRLLGLVCAYTSAPSSI